MNLMLIVLIFLQIVIGYNLVIPFFLYISHLLKKDKLIKRPDLIGSVADFAIIVTAFEQTSMLPEVINSILKINYSNYLVYVVADNCDISNLQFASDKIIILRPPEILQSNTRSHFYAIRHFKRAHPRVTIVDSDNLVHPEYLNELNIFFDAEYQAVQGVREARNLDTTYACLDAARDIYYHFYDGKLLFDAGSSATLSGSGMAFTTQLYKDCLEQLDITGAGFDKVLQYEIVNKKIQIAFCENAIVYDAKTSHSDQLVKQRSRWINTWFRYFKFGFKLLGRGVANLNWNQFLFGIILLRPPLFIFLILSVLLMLITLFIAPLLSLVWLAGLIIFIISFFIALKKSATDKRIYKSLYNIPVFIFYQIISLLKMRKANKYSVATQHFYKKG